MTKDTSTRTHTNYAWSTKDIVDVRTLLLRAEALADPAPDELEEHRELDRILSELRGSGGDQRWRGAWYPAVLIRDSYFVTYAQDLAAEIGMDFERWPYTCIDWEHAAQELRYDYYAIEIAGSLYWTRS